MALVARMLALAGMTLVSLSAHAADLFNNTNTGGVLNGATGRPMFMTPVTVHVTQLVTYHWNNGMGARPGTISLHSMSGPTYGPFPVQATSGQGNAPNVNWIADVNLTLPIGTYELIDSDPGTWSQNAMTRGIGFAIIRGEQVSSTTPPPPPPPVVSTTPGRLPPPAAPPPVVPPPGRTVPVPPAPPVPTPTGPVTELFNNTNTGAVQNGAKGEVLLISYTPLHITQLQTYHWNNAKGAAPGTLTLKNASGFPTYGPFPARGTPGTNNVPNVNWLADVNLTLPAGTYQLIDSDPATWSQNSQSHNIGFAIIRGTRGGPAGGTPAPGGGGTGGAGGGGGGKTPPVNFTPCMSNAGSIASMEPCAGAPGTKITLRLNRAIAKPLKGITFKPYQVTGIPGATGAQVLAPVSGNATAPGSFYEVDVPKQLCIGNGGSWDLFPFDTANTPQGDIGRFTVDCRAGVAPGGGGAPKPTTTPPPPPPGPAAFAPCFVNSGSVAAVSPCTVHPGDIITIRLSRNLTQPITKVTFKPYQVGLPSATAAQVIVTVSGQATSGSNYNFATPAQLCVGGTGSWDVWPYDAKGTGLGDIGRVNVICR